MSAPAVAWMPGEDARPGAPPGDVERWRAWWLARRWFLVLCAGCSAWWNVRDDVARYRCASCGELQPNPRQRVRSW